MNAIALAPPELRLTARGVFQSENGKLWTLRSPRWLIFAMVFVPFVLAMVRAASTPPATATQQHLGSSAALESIAIGGLPVGFIAAVLGLIAMGSEYTDDALAVTFTASPRRRLVIAAKCASVTIASLLAAALGFAGSAILASMILAGRGYGELPVSDMVEIVGAGALGVALLSVLGLACASLTGSVIGAAIHLACLLAVAPVTIGVAGGPRTVWLTNLLPATALQAAVTRAPANPFTIEGAPPSTLYWWGGLAVLASWSIVYLGLVMSRIQRREIATPQRSLRSRTVETGSRTDRVPTGLNARGVVQSELVKLLSLPATWWLLGLSSVATVGLAMYRASGVRPEDWVDRPIPATELAMLSTANHVDAIVAGFGFTQILLTFFGAVAFTSEFTSGNIRPTVIAVPRRALLFLTKLGVVVLATAVASTGANILAAVLATPIVRQMGFDGALQAPEVTETILRCVLASILVSALGCAFGALLRAPISSIAMVVGVFILSHTALGGMQIPAAGTPWVWFANLHSLFPDPVRAVLTFPGNTDIPLILRGSVLQLDPNLAMLVLAAWTVVGLAVSLHVFRHRGI